MDDHDLLIRIDERMDSLCKRIDDMKEDIDERMEEQRVTLANVTMMIDEQLTVADKRLTKLERWKTKSKTLYGVAIAVISFMLYTGVACVLKFL